MTVTINKASQKMVMNAIKTMNFDEVDRIDAIAKKELLAIFDSVASGSVNLIYYDSAPVVTSSGAVSVMRHALHRSTKKDGFLQLSVMELKNGYMIPCYDLQFCIADGFPDFWREAPNHLEINFI